MTIVYETTSARTPSKAPRAVRLSQPIACCKLPARACASITALSVTVSGGTPCDRIRWRRRTASSGCAVLAYAAIA
eukprot:5588792-Prymnesium_polylepis.1